MGTSNGSSRHVSASLEVKLIVHEYVRRQFGGKGVQWTAGRLSNGNGNGNGIGAAPLAVAEHQAGVVGPGGASTKRDQTVTALCSVTNELMSRYGPSIVEMCDRLALPLPGQQPGPDGDQWSEIGFTNFAGVADELFADGVKWVHILMLFVFGSELAFFYGVRKNQMNLVDDVTAWMIAYVNSRLLAWINDHGGWEGFMVYANTVGNGADVTDRNGGGPQNGRPAGGQAPDEAEIVDGEGSFWTLKKLLGVGGAVGAIGAAITLASILFTTKHGPA